MTITTIIAFAIGALAAAIVWTVAYRCGHLSGYEAGRADALDDDHRLAWAHAEDFCRALANTERSAS